MFPGTRHGVRQRTVRAGFLTVQQALPVLLAAQAGHPDRGGHGRRSLQVRLGRDYPWCPYRRIGSNWEPAGRPNPDPAAALAALLDS